MRFLLLSDIHATSKQPIARKDDIMATFFEKFTFILEYAKKHNCVILQAGDFFDKERDWYLLFNLMKLLNKYKVPIYSIFGQHDSYLYSNINKTPTTLSILNRVGLVKMLRGVPVRIGSKIKIYGSSWQNPIPKPDAANPLNILVIHDTIYTKPLFPRHKFTRVKRFAKQNNGYKLILVGDIHRRFVYINQKTHVINTGPMLRLDAIEYNRHHRPAAFIYDSRHDTVNKISIPHKKSEDVLDYTHLTEKDPTTAARTEWIRLIREHQVISPNIKTNIRSAIRKNPISRRAKQILLEVIEDES